MKTALLGLAGVVVGLIVAFFLLSVVEVVCAAVYPPPEGAEKSMEVMCRYIESYPNWVLGVAVPMWAATAFVSTWIAQRIGSFYAGVPVGLLLVAALILNVSMLPYPIWFKVACLLVIPIAVFAGIRLTGRQIPKAGTPMAAANGT